MDTTPSTAGVDERQLAVDLFNHCWTLLARDRRSRDEDDEMLHAAHASRFHWGRVGGPENRARGEWQCSRVYCVLDRAEPALHHARRCLELCEEHGLADWDLAFAYEALARAHRVAGDDGEAERFRELARTVPVAEAEDRELLESDLASI
ncbi:MAG TPA: hypothetical protein VIU44_15055 [Gaiellaceae bacterium]